MKFLRRITRFFLAVALLIFALLAAKHSFSQPACAPAIQVQPQGGDSYAVTVDRAALGAEGEEVVLSLELYIPDARRRSHFHASGQPPKNVRVPAGKARQVIDMRKLYPELDEGAYLFSLNGRQHASMLIEYCRE